MHRSESIQNRFTRRKMYPKQHRAHHNIQCDEPIPHRYIVNPTRENHRCIEVSKYRSVPLAVTASPAVCSRRHQACLQVLYESTVRYGDTVLSCGMTPLVWGYNTVPYSYRLGRMRGTVPVGGTGTSVHVQRGKRSNRDNYEYSKADQPAVFHCSNTWFRQVQGPLEVLG